METFPKKGMYFEQVRSRIKKYDSIKQGNTNLKESLINQARLHDGEGAASELNKEFDTNNHSSNKVGYSPGYGNNWDKIFIGSGKPQNPDSSGSS